MANQCQRCGVAEATTSVEIPGHHRGVLACCEPCKRKELALQGAPMPQPGEDEDSTESLGLEHPLGRS